jgi:hypothetical protein
MTTEHFQALCNCVVSINPMSVIYSGPIIEPTPRDIILECGSSRESCNLERRAAFARLVVLLAELIWSWQVNCCSN